MQARDAKLPPVTAAKHFFAGTRLGTYNTACRLSQ